MTRLQAQHSTARPTTIAASTSGAASKAQEPFACLPAHVHNSVPRHLYSGCSLASKASSSGSEVRWSTTSLKHCPAFKLLLCHKLLDQSWHNVRPKQQASLHFGHAVAAAPSLIYRWNRGISACSTAAFPEPVCSLEAPGSQA